MKLKKSDPNGCLSLPYTNENCQGPEKQTHEELGLVKFDHCISKEEKVSTRMHSSRMRTTRFCGHY